MFWEIEQEIQLLNIPNFTMAPINMITTKPILFYEDPSIQINLDELETLSKGRFRILKLLEVKKRPVEFNNEAPSREIALQKIKENDVFNYELSKLGISMNQETYENCDTISHFILKLAVCKSQEDSKWWIDSEVKLFKWRCSRNESFVTMMAEKLNLKTIQNGEIVFNHFADKELYPKSDIYYEAPLSICTSLLSRGYFPLKGKVYVTPKDLKVIAIDIYRSGLELALEEAQKVDITDERLLRLFGQLKDPDFDFGYKINPAKNRGINLQNLNQLADTHFPPCMKKLFYKLSTESHLKHFGRLQLGLFIKGIGLSLEESLEFWRKKFTEKITLEKFNKGYKYNIEHSYGKAGKMADYSPWSCTKITKMPKPAFGEHHGCPFRHSDKSELISLLGTYPGLRPEVKKWIMERHEFEPQVSCIRLFEDIRPRADTLSTQKVGIHPNSFFDASYEYKPK